MKIDDFARNEQNEVVAICGDKQVVLSADYIAANKPQVGDEIESPAEEAESPVEKTEEK
ncbi:hypothetical protein [Caudoviricetes sp.]|jgi:hypothetical protein|nr:hypothetical protein [Caudoviricetes sp.]